MQKNNWTQKEWVKGRKQDCSLKTENLLNFLSQIIPQSKIWFVVARLTVRPD